MDNSVSTAIRESVRRISENKTRVFEKADRATVEQVSPVKSVLIRMFILIFVRQVDRLSNCHASTILIVRH